jgi:hypothetical protein
VEPLFVLVVVLAIALVAVGFVAWQGAVGVGVLAAYRERSADASPPLAVFLATTGAGGSRLVVRNRGELAALRVRAWERRALAHDPAPLVAIERIEPAAAAEVDLAEPPTAPVCHLEWTPDRPGASRRQADVPFLLLEAPRA